MRFSRDSVRLCGESGGLEFARMGSDKMRECSLHYEARF
jgi:hypothetical protein